MEEQSSGSTESISELAKALSKAQAEMGHASKDASNPHFKSKYADFAAVVDAIRKPLTNNGLSFVQLVGSDDKGGVTVTTRLLHTSGESISSTLALPVGQQTPQAYGSAITYGRRYSLSAMVGLASEEDDDGNAASVTAPATTVRGTEALKAKIADAPKPVPPPAAPKAAPPPASPPRKLTIQDKTLPPEPGTDAPRDFEIRYARNKGQMASTLSRKDLEWYAGNALTAAGDPDKARFKDANMAEFEALHAWAELAKK